MHPEYDVTVIVCTYNRGNLLGPALESIAAQNSEGVRYEVIVVDNNSTDSTKKVIERFIAKRSNWTYVFEGQQGISHARNAGVAQAKAPILAFTDDDVRVAPDWVARVKEAMDTHPEVDFFGGKVFPRWNRMPPRWLTKMHWSPLAIVDHGELPFYVDSKRPWCMVGANLSMRRSVLLEAGGFSPRFQRVKDAIGSTEDHELQLRLWRAGRRGMYLPALQVSADVQNERLRKEYHRRWHAGHARFSAMMGTEVITDDMPELFGVPACHIRLMMGHVARWARAMAEGRTDRAFFYENKIRFLLRYAQAHRVEQGRTGAKDTFRKTLQGVGEIAKRKLALRQGITGTGSERPSSARPSSLRARDVAAERRH